HSRGIRSRGGELGVGISRHPHRSLRLLAVATGVLPLCAGRAGAVEYRRGGWLPAAPTARPGAHGAARDHRHRLLCGGARLRPEAGPGWLCPPADRLGAGGGGGDRRGHRPRTAALPPPAPPPPPLLPP